MLNDAQWAMLEPLIEACRPKGKTPPEDLRRTISVIVWRHQNGAKWRAIPEELGPRRVGALVASGSDLQPLGASGCLGTPSRAGPGRGVQLGMTFLDGTSIRAHHKAAGAARKGAHKLNGTHVRRWGARVADMAPRPA